MNAKNTYRIIDSKGRVLIPKDMHLKERLVN